MSEPMPIKNDEADPPKCDRNTLICPLAWWANKEVPHLRIERDAYRSLALRHEARIAELVVLLQEALDSRAPDYIDAVHPGWSGRARAVLNAPAADLVRQFNEWTPPATFNPTDAGFSLDDDSQKEVMPNSVAAESDDHSCDKTAPRPAQSPAGAEAMSGAILQALPGGTEWVAKQFKRLRGQ